MAYFDTYNKRDCKKTLIGNWQEERALEQRTGNARGVVSRTNGPTPVCANGLMAACPRRAPLSLACGAFHSRACASALSMLWWRFYGVPVST
jgi:hypothetical protein